MTWDDIRYFLAVARSGSIAQAARQLEVAYTTVSRRIDAFEDRLGTRLFDRLPTGYVPTAEAEAVLDEALAMEERAAAFDRGLFGQDRRLSGQLRVATSDAVATSLLLPHLHRFEALHPDISLEIASSENVVNLDLREADIAVRVTGAPPDHLIGRKVGEATYGVFASQDYRSAHRSLNRPSVRALTWIGEGSPPAWHQNEFAKTPFGPRFDSAIAMVSAIRAGLGIGSVPDFLVAHEPTLVRVNRRRVESGWGVWILTHPDTKTSARVRAFRTFLASVLDEQRASICVGGEPRRTGRGRR